MRDWYKNNLEKKTKRKSKILYYLIPIWLIFVFYYGRNTFKESLVAEPVVLSQKLTSSLLDKDLNERILMYNNGTDNITYVVEAYVTNVGRSGLVSVDASFNKDNNLLTKSETLHISENDTVITKFLFTVPFIPGAKRNYSVRTQALKENNDLSVKDI